MCTQLLHVTSLTKRFVGKMNFVVMYKTLNPPFEIIA